LQRHRQDEQGDPDLSGANERLVQRRIAARQSVYPVRNALIHSGTALETIEVIEECQIHRVFQASVLLKGAHALIECVSRIALAIISTDTISRLVNAFTQEELRDRSSASVPLFVSSPASGRRGGAGCFGGGEAL
jgi:hypothetical protein